MSSFNISNYISHILINNKNTSSGKWPLQKQCFCRVRMVWQWSSLPTNPIKLWCHSEHSLVGFWDLVNRIETTPFPRATRCGGDIVTLLWFRVCVRPSVDLVNRIETTPFHVTLSNLADMLTMMRGWTLFILEVRGQRSRSQWTYMEISLWTR